MRIDAAASYLYTHTLRTAPRAQEITAARAMEATQATQATAAAQEAQAPREDGARQVDFTRMTRRELREWTNEKFLGGELSFDEMSELATLGITGISIDDLKRGNWYSDDDITRYNYMQIACDAMPFARTCDDGGKFLKGLETALSVMERYQVSGVDTFA